MLSGFSSRKISFLLAKKIKVCEIRNLRIKTMGLTSSSTERSVRGKTDRERDAGRDTGTGRDRNAGRDSLRRNQAIHAVIALTASIMILISGRVLCKTYITKLDKKKMTIIYVSIIVVSVMILFWLSKTYPNDITDIPGID